VRMKGAGALRLRPRRAPRAAGEPAAVGRPSKYDGILQGIGSGAALGWAVDRAHPDTRVTVAVVVDDELVAEGVADVARPDLADRNLGDGAHGFLIGLPGHLQAPGRRNIVVLAGPERAPIPVAPSFWQKPAADGAWSDVVFEAGGSLSGLVPPPPRRSRPRAMVGADGWLFLEEESRAQTGEAELEGAVAALADNARRCAELGIAYVPALVPCKRDVVHDTPSGARARPWGTLRAKLRDVDGVELLDLLAVLRDATRHGALYHRTDADWNDRGAFFVARALLKEAHKHETALRPLAIADLCLLQVAAYRGTLADAPRAQAPADWPAPVSEVVSERGVTLDASKLRALRMPVERHLAEAGDAHLRVYAAPAQDGRARLALVGDAAALALVPWLAERASRTTFFWSSRLPLDQLELELPPVVLHLVREADLLSGAFAEHSAVGR
jgi:hypothetical protein